MITVLTDTSDGGPVVAKGKNKSGSTGSGEGRDANAVASRRLHLSPPPKTPVADSVLRSRNTPPSPSIADGRVWHPDRSARPALYDSGVPASPNRLVDRARVHSWSQKKALRPRQGSPSKFRYGPTYQSQTKAVLAFHAPQSVNICKRRSTRKQVIHAKGIAGGRVKKPRFNQWSKYSCRR